MKVETDVWVTQLALAKELNMSLQAIQNWIRRGKIDFLKLPNSRIRLVNRNSITVSTSHHKRR